MELVYDVIGNDVSLKENVSGDDGDSDGGSGDGGMAVASQKFPRW